MCAVCLFDILLAALSSIKQLLRPTVTVLSAVVSYSRNLFPLHSCLQPKVRLVVSLRNVDEIIWDNNIYIEAVLFRIARGGLEIEEEMVCGGLQGSNPSLAHDKYLVYGLSSPLYAITFENSSAG